MNSVESRTHAEHPAPSPDLRAPPEDGNGIRTDAARPEDGNGIRTDAARPEDGNGIRTDAARPEDGNGIRPDAAPEGTTYLPAPPDGAAITPTDAMEHVKQLERQEAHARALLKHKQAELADASEELDRLQHDIVRERAKQTRDELVRCVQIKQAQRERIQREEEIALQQKRLREEETKLAKRNYRQLIQTLTMRFAFEPDPDAGPHDAAAADASRGEASSRRSVVAEKRRRGEASSRRSVVAEKRRR